MASLRHQGATWLVCEYLKVDRGRDVAALEVHTAVLSNEEDGAFISTHFFPEKNRYLLVDC